LISGTGPTCSDTIVQTVIVNPPPIVTVSSPTVCVGQAATLTAVGAATYSWSTGSTSNPITVTPATTTSYAVTGTTTLGCFSVTTATVTVIPLMVPVIGNTNVSCFGGSNGTVSVMATGGRPGYSYSWNTTPIQTTALVTGLKIGTYTVTITDAGGCTITASATITEPPLLTATASAINVKCHDGSDGLITATAAGGTIGYNYSWNTSPVQTTAVATGLKKGNYIVTVMDAKGCTTTASSVITEPPGFTLTTSATNVKCHDGNDGSAKVNVSGNTSPYTYSWNTRPVQAAYEAVALTKGTYIVTVTDVIGCSISATVIVTEPSPTIVNLGPDKDLCPESDPPVTFNAGPGFKYFWQPTGDTTQSIVVNMPGTYSVTVTNQLGCSVRTSANVREVCPPRLFISNSFTPNADGINDRYNVYGAHFTNFHMFIFNRWGEIIFESKDRSVVWDGIYRDVPMPIGVYPWIITYTGDSEEYFGPYRLEGSVTVVR
jgi:gliding motility-associated-like protein